MTEARVFVNYRRKDAPGSAGRLHDDLADRFGGTTVFRDVQMRPGIDFVDEITRAAGACHVLLAVIGPRWSSITGDDGRRRIMDPGDYVRLEIETAIARPDVVVVPVLVEDAVMPMPGELPPSLRELTRLNACRLNDSSWDYDVHRLGDALEPVLGTMTMPVVDPPPQPEPEPRRERALSASHGAAAALGLLAAGPIALILSQGLHDRPAAAGAGSIGDLDDARRRIVFYALERGVTWAVVGAAVLAAWVVLARAERPLLGSALAGASAGFIGGFIGGVLFQGSKYLHNPSLSTTLEVPSGVTARAAGYAVAAGLIGWTLAGATRRLTRLEGAAAGMGAGVLAALFTAATSGMWRWLGLGLEALIVGAGLMVAILLAERAREPARIALPLAGRPETRV